MTEKTATNPLRYLNADLPAGIVVFLVALPLCLGVALASGAPLFAGIVTGTVAGILVTWLSGSDVSVSGPAAGLTVIVASGIASLGQWEIFLCAVVVSGIFQILFAAVRAGAVAALIPNSVITGMLAAIGIIIILKQIPHGLGQDGDYEGDMSFWHMMGSDNTFTDIVNAAYTHSTGVLIITLSSMAVLILWNKLPKAFKRMQSFLPGPLAAVLTGIIINELYRVFFPAFHIGAASGHLVQLPVPESVESFFLQLSFPKFSMDHISQIGSVGLVLALVGSIETLLCLEAGDKIDVYRRTSNGNRELFAQGIGNIVAGFLGGLPMTSVVVRTSANVYAGARTRMSAFVHGMLLLVCAALFARYLNLIPLGSLAAVLIVVGYKLSSAGLIVNMYKRGIDQFLPFAVTLLAIVFTDILTGVFAGLITSMFFVVKSNYHSAITLVNQDSNYMIRFTKDVSFVNKVNLKNALRKIPNDCNLIIDGTQAIFIDKDIFEVIEDFKKSASFRGIKVECRNLASKQIKLFGSASTKTEVSANSPSHV